MDRISFTENMENSIDRNLAFHNVGSSTVAFRPKTFNEQQPYIWAYSGIISLFSPAASLYQLIKLNPSASKSCSRATMMRLPLTILPAQTILKATQMNLATPVKEQFNPWMAFALVGVLQGGVYGQANIYFSKKLNIGKLPTYAGMFRGVPFAGVRDMISQGVPYVFSDIVLCRIVFPLFGGNRYEKNETVANTLRWGSILGTSIFATYCSQVFHNIQITMQAHQEISHIGAVQKAFSENGTRLFYRGAEARVGLLLVVNVLNELLLKKAWKGVPLEDTN